MITYKSLENVGISVLAAAVSQLESTFSDSDELKNMLEQSGYNESISVGAFDGEVLAAFALNGDFEKSAFIIADGALPDYGEELTANAIKKAAELMKERGITAYKTDALTDNTKAVEFYKSCGFTPTAEVKDDIFTAEEPKTLIWQEFQMDLTEG